MADIEELIGVLPFIGSILNFIALLTPAAVNEVKYGGIILVCKYKWMWGFEYIYYYNYIEDFYFPTNPIEIISSIICSIIVVLNSSIILITTCMVWKGKKNIADVEKYWLITAISLIIIASTWNIIMELINEKIFSFWKFYKLGFGLIGVYIGAFLTIIGYGIKNQILKKTL